MDPYFDVVTAEIRGFDLGDDDELLGELVRRRAQSADTMEVSDWLLLGVLMHRAGIEQEAWQCFERAAAAKIGESLPRYLQAQLCLDRGQPDEAEALLDLADEANEHEPRIPAAELVHARGSLALARGEPHDALAQYATGLREDDSSYSRWLDLANLCRVLDRAGDAYEAAMQAAKLGPDVEPALYTLACAAAEAGNPAAAIEALRSAFAIDPQRRRAAAEDPAFSPFADNPELAALLEPPPAPCLDWLDAFPTWLQLLRADPLLAEAGVRWLDDEESLRATETLVDPYARGGPAGVLHTEPTLALSRELLEGRRIVAEGPRTPTRDGSEERSWLLLDVRDPTQLWIALTDAYPPFLWLDGGAAAQSVCEALAEFFPRPGRQRRQLTAHARGFMGYRGRFGVMSPYSGEVEPADEVGLDHHFALCPFVEAGSWGSAFADDPWPDDIPSQPNSALLFGRRQREVNRQTTGSVWSLTRRARHSRGYVSFELHHQELFIGDVRYAPSRQHAVVARMNSHFGCDYPTDMPVDIIATLLGFSFDSAQDLQTELESTANPQELAGLLSLLSALRHSDLRVVRLFRRYMDHPDAVVRTTLWNVFAAYNFESLLEEAILLESDPEIVAQLEVLLCTGIPAVEHDTPRPARVSQESSS